MTEPLSHHAALIYTMVIMSAADRDMSDAELGAMSDMVSHLPVFRDYDKSMISKTSASCIETLKGEDGLQKLLKLIRASLPEKLRETAYALACDVVAADSTVTQEEARLLDMLRYELQIGNVQRSKRRPGSAAQPHPPGTHWYHPHAHGSTHDQVASGLAGFLIVEGDVGRRVAERMRGGWVDVRGNAGSNAGGAYAGSRRGMSGGELVVHGSADAFLGQLMRRGVIATGGSAGDYAGAGMIAGTILIFGDAGRRPGAGLRRGSIVIHGAVDLLPTYRYACTYRPSFLDVYLRELQDNHGMEIEDPIAHSRYACYGGDFAELGRGEILLAASPPDWVSANIR